MQDERGLASEQPGRIHAQRQRIGAVSGGFLLGPAILHGDYASRVGSTELSGAASSRCSAPPVMA
jgi:hypothetical protein